MQIQHLNPVWKNKADYVIGGALMNDLIDPSIGWIDQELLRKVL